MMFVIPKMPTLRQYHEENNLMLVPFKIILIARIDCVMETYRKTKLERKKEGTGYILEIEDETLFHWNSPVREAPTQPSHTPWQYWQDMPIGEIITIQARRFDVPDRGWFWISFFPQGVPQ